MAVHTNKTHLYSPNGFGRGAPLKSCNENEEGEEGKNRTCKESEKGREGEKEKEKISGLLFPFPGHDMINRFLLI